MGLIDATDDDVSSNTADAEDYERVDVSGMEFAKMHPTVAVSGTARTLRYLPGDPDEGNLDRGSAGLIVEDPSVYTAEPEFEGSTIFKATGDRGDDYKVVNVDDDATNEIPDTGVDFDGNVFYSDQIDGFDVDELVLKLTGNAGRSATCCLDVHGEGRADVERDEDGEMILSDNGYPTYNGSLLERFDNDEENYTPPRFARDTQLRPDVEGQEVVIMLRRTRDVIGDYHGDAYWTNVLVADDGAEDGYTELEPTDEYEPDEALVRATNWLEEAYPSDEQIARACIAQGVSVPDRIQEELDNLDELRDEVTA
jgi:hypothetical protein